MSQSPEKKPRLDDPCINLNLEMNRKAHYTDSFENPSLIVRRGFPINITTTAPIDGVKLVYIAGTKHPQRDSQRLFAGWKLETKSSETNNYQLTPPSNCAVGRWTIKFTIDAKEVEMQATILFNPFCKDDQVYMECPEEQEEYILSDTGLVFIANSWRIKPQGCGWVFGQFESRVLECCLALLERSPLTPTSKSSATLVSRSMTALVNAQDDNGVIEGDWSGDYSGGTDPSEWTGSVDILLQYLETEKPVKYGQCWVFSGVLVTVLRALGIPCRSVTNIRSAHDTENNLVIDIFHDRHGNRLESDDSVWNFHLWNEMWTKRPDLPDGCDGWQALDATPQEMSDGCFQAGPASLNAIKSGAVYLPYDARFIFAEVNADRVYWREDSDGNYRIKKIDKKHVGRMVVTKAIGCNDVDDITDQYKHKEGSEEERYQTRLAVTFGTEPDIYENVEDEDEVKMKFHCEEDYIIIGQPIEYTVKLILKDMERATALFNATASVYGYNGKFICNVQSHKCELLLPEQKVFKGRIESSEYESVVRSGSIIKISVMYDLKEATDMGFLEEEIPLRAPPPKVEILSQEPYIVGVPIQLKFSFKNRFSSALTGGYFRLDAPGFSSRDRLEIDQKLLEPGIECSYRVEYKPRKKGKINLVVSFNSDQHKGLHTYKHINVQNSKSDDF
ncbi:protein-glutamine gamma-glutamyltransferase K-like isoform X2 [Convolutriloba macropyga]|uniref:protein-glutamine gamma-glutamyltransferase K-like isoform X2 n=1 Tax=Convolutriloba macropyga TaxID=536237 RepID=UPI003F527589